MLDRPVPFFSWNERMEPEEVRRQVDLIAAAGWGGVFVHSRVGLTTPYMSDEWFAAVDAALERCRELGLKLWLYDEDKWPSGYSGGKTPLASEEFRQHALIARPAELPAREDCASIGEPQQGLQMYVWTSPLGHEWFNGTSYADLMSAPAMRQFLDDAYEPYHERYADHFGDTIVGVFTDEPCSIFRNRLPTAAIPYSPALPEEFKKQHGYDPVPHLHLLFNLSEFAAANEERYTRDPARPDAARFRLHYYRTINTLFENNFSRQLGDWCRARNVAFTGHYMAEDSLHSQQAWGVKIMPNYRHQDMPGIDHLCRQAGQPMTAKQCQSVVNQYGKKRMLCEIYGVDGDSLTFADRAWIAAQQMCLGVNLLNPHLSLYSMSGCRKRDYPQNIYYQQPFWPLNRVLDDRLSRVCAALAQGKYATDILVIHPQESVFLLWEPNTDPAKFDEILAWDHKCSTPESTAAIDELDQQFKAVIEKLLASQLTFDLGDETILADDGTVEERGTLRVREMSYRSIIVPSMLTMSATTLALLTDFLETGGHLVCCGPPATLLDGEPSAELDHFYSRIRHCELDALPRLVGTDAAVSIRSISSGYGESLLVHVRDLAEDERLVYAVNLHRTETLRCELSFSDGYDTAFLLNTVTGEAEELATRQYSGGLLLPSCFAPGEAHLLLLRTTDAESTATKSLVPAPITAEQQLSKWNLTRLDDNALPLDYASWRRGKNAWSARPVPVIGIQDYLNSMKYDGPLSLRYTFNVERLPSTRKSQLVIEHPDRYTISLNGNRVQYDGLPHWRDIRWLPIDVTGMLVDGKNEVLLECDFQHGDLTSVEDHFARYGTEIESIFLIGDFHVHGRTTGEHPVAPHWSQFGLPPIEVECFAGDSLKITEPAALQPGSTITQGLPFYAGRLRLEIQLPELSMRDGEWYVAIDKLDAAVAEVALDGQTIGHFVAPPLEVKLPHISLGAILQVTLYGTLRNLLGPHHHPAGEMASVCPGHFSAQPPAKPGAVNDWVLRYEKGQEIEGWTDRYCVVGFGDIGEIKLLRH